MLSSFLIIRPFYPLRLYKPCRISKNEDGYILSPIKLCKFKRNCAVGFKLH